MKAVRPAAPANGILCCWLRSVLAVALATPADLAGQTPCLPLPGCAGPECEPYLDRADAFL